MIVITKSSAICEDSKKLFYSNSLKTYINEIPKDNILCYPTILKKAQCNSTVCQKKLCSCTKKVFHFFVFLIMK